MQARQQKLNGMNGLTPAERAHWSRVQAAIIGKYNFFGKTKQNNALVVRLAGEISDLATADFRTRANGKRSGK